MPRKKILVIGDVMLDAYHFGQVNRISPEAPVPVFLESKKTHYSPGGAANVAVNLSAIGIETELCAIIGNDTEGQHLLELLSDKNVGSKYVYVEETGITTTKLRYIGPNNQQMIRIDSEDIREVSMDVISTIGKEVESQIEQYGLFVLSDYLKGFLTAASTQYFIKLAVNHGVPVFVDVKDENYKKYYGAMLIKPNKRELAALSGMVIGDKESATKAAQYLCERTEATYVLATLGAEGMILVGREGLIKSLKSMARDVYDVTGAGDTSIAYLAASYMLGESMERSTEIANVAAGIQVAKAGTAIVTPIEVEAELNRFEDDSVYNDVKTIVFTNGCFDVIHAGHVSYLKQAKKLGDKLIVGINSDASVRRLKGPGRPINTLKDRICVLEALSCVDEVIVFDEDTPLELIKKISPDVLVKGGDYSEDSIVGADYVKKGGGCVKVLPFLEGHSTSKILERMQKGTT